MTWKMNLVSISMEKQIPQYAAPQVPVYTKYSNYVEVFYQKKQFVPRDHTVLKKQQRLSNQSISKIARPYDLESDDSLGASIKKEFVRFYEVHDESYIIKISSEIIPEKSSNGRIIGGPFKIRQGSQWLTKQADPKKMYALIRRRSEDKKCKENGKKFSVASRKYYCTLRCCWRP